MGKIFLFIDGVQADEQSKRLSRRHVMKGKNLGKKLHRPSKVETAQHQVGHGKAVSNGMAVNPSIWLTSNPTKGQLSVRYPIEIPAESVKIIHDFYAFVADKIYPTRIISLDEAKLMWLEGLIIDEDVYECNIALMSACNEIFLSGGKSPPKALHYLSRTFAIVKRRLQSDEALSDSTMTIILSLVYQEQIRQQQAAASIHFKGLEQMIELRGGLKALMSNAPLMLKICKTDLMFALKDGQAPTFFRDCFPDLEQLLASSGYHLQLPSLTSLPVLNDLDPTLSQVLLDMLRFSTVLNHGPIAEPIVDLGIYMEFILSLSYRLLRFRSLNSAKQIYDENSGYHLGLVIFMMTSFLQFDARRMVHFYLVPLCLKHVLSGMEQSGINPDAGFQLWLMIMGGIWVSASEDSEWLLTKLRTTAGQMGVSTWTQARAAISGFPWINELHDQAGLDMWKEMSGATERAG